MREKSEKSDKKPTLTKRMKDFLMIFENNMGLVGVSCKNSKVGQSTYYDWLGNKRFEEEISGIKTKVKDFGEHALFKLIKKGNLMLKRMSPFEIARSVEGMLEKEKGELLIDIDPVVLPEHYKPSIVVVDSLTAVASAFTGKDDSYRIYIEQLFRFFEKLGATSFLITETKQIPEVFSTTGVEEFLADGVVVMYNFKRGDIRENAIEVLKMRGEKHKKKIVASQITDDGMIVYPDQEVFGNTE